MAERFYEKTGEDRYGAYAMAGDPAENAVSRVCEEMGRPLAPFGPRRVDTSRGQQMTWPPLIRHTPDFLQFGRFIECQGFGKSGEIIFKKEKLESLNFWNGFMPVFFGLYDSHNQTVTFADLPAVWWAVHHPDSKPLVLDEDTAYPKEAWAVPYSVLMERRVNDAFAAHKILEGL